jgi:uncharacterized NAD(P)/FAD-binding protein YdhS
MTHDTRVIVIGGGFSGAMTAAHLAGRGIATTVLEPGALGRGVAYAATPYPLLLNTRASAMSALPDQPQHFEAWLEHRLTTGAQAAAGPADRLLPLPAGDGARAFANAFAPRAVYGDYLASTIAEVSRGQLDVVASRARDLLPTSRGFAVTCEDGRTLTCERVVLALGNAPPRTPSVVDGALPGYVAEPYAGIAAIDDGDPVAILGTGLTALDVICGLRARGHRGRITCISRRGLVPAAHGAPPRHAITVPRGLVRQPHLRTLLAWWRDAVTLARADRNDGEAAVIAALRPLLPTIWRRLPIADRARFLRHVRPRWDVLRHRAPPSVRAVLELGLAEGSIEIVAGRLDAARATPGGLRCEVANACGTQARDVRWLLNCTGPERDLRRSRSALVHALLDRRLVAPDPLGLGVFTGTAGQLIGEDGLVRDAYVVGPWRMADLFEASAVPELRQHAADTAAAIADEAADEARVQVAI